MSSHIDFSNMSTLETAVVLEAAFDCIKRASTFGAKVFGGFVRNVIVPRQFDPNCSVSFKDIDLWFTTQASVDAFLREMGTSLVKYDLISVSAGSYPGAFSRNQYHLYKYGMCLAWIDVVVSPTLPVNDFDVNEVTYKLNSHDEWVTTSPSRLIQQIRDKHAVMLPCYQVLIEKAQESDNFSTKYNPRYKIYYEERTNRIFTSKGWTVSVPTWTK
jgi:hypothetical protein